MPGVPSIYYGSEWGIEGKRSGGDDHALRPRLDLFDVSHKSPHRDLAGVISRLARIRRHSEALRYGNYRQLLVSHEQFAFARQSQEECVIVAVNAADRPVPFELSLSVTGRSRLLDLLNEGESFSVNGGRARIDAVKPCWSRIMIAK
jgi:glycosidase